MSATGKPGNRRLQLDKQMAVGKINAFILWLAAILGAGASIKLLLTERAHVVDPSAALECDVNALIGCGASLMSKQAHFLGIPNSILGIVAFAALMVFATVAMLRALPRPLWILGGIASLGGIIFVIWFLYHSVVTFGTLCPYCLLVWSATFFAASVLIPAAWVAWKQPPTAELLMKHTWAYALVLHLAVAIVVILSMQEQIGASL